MSKAENLKIGLEYFEEIITRIDEMSIETLLDNYGKLKVLEVKAFSLRESNIAYSAQALKYKIEEKIIAMTKKR